MAPRDEALLNGHRSISNIAPLVDSALRLLDTTVDDAADRDLYAAAHEVSGDRDDAFEAVLEEMRGRRRTVPEAGSLRLTRASNVTPAPVNWIWPGRVPKRLFSLVVRAIASATLVLPAPA